MVLDARKMWAETVAQAWVNLEADGPTHEDTLLIKIDEHIRSLEGKLAEHYHKNDIETSRGLTREQIIAIANLQIIGEGCDES